MAQQILNDGELGLVIRGKINAMFAEIYATLWTRVTKPTTQSGITSTSFIDIADLLFPITANEEYDYDAWIVASSTNATEGVGVSVNGVNLTTLRQQSLTALSSTTIVGHSVNAFDTASASATLQNGGSLIRIWGKVKSTSAQNIQLRVRAETGAGQSVSILAGSFVQYRKSGV